MCYSVIQKYKLEKKMDIKPSDKTIRDLLISKRQFVIPRFQREYSWDKKITKNFWMICLEI